MARTKQKGRSASLLGPLPDGSVYPTPSPRRQPAVSTACDFCRRRKIRCNGEQPCDKCQQHRRAHTCHFQDRSDRPSNDAAGIASETQNSPRQQAPVGQQNGAAGPPHTSRVPANISQARSEDLEPDFVHAVETASPSIAQFSPGTPRPPRHSSPTSSAVANIIAGLGNPRHAQRERSATPQHAVMSNLRVNNRGESRYHGPTSASFSAHEQLNGDQHAGAANTAANGFSQHPRVSIDAALLTERLTSLAARERQQELMNVVAGRLDFDGVDPELAIHLLNLHWNRQHHAYLVTYRPLFMRDMAAPPGKAKYFSKLLFHAILFGAAKFSDRIHQVRSDVNDPSSAGMQFLERVQQLLPEALIKSRITTVQALLLLACTHYARGSESAAWLHSGLAFRMATDLGMNEDSIELVASGTMALEELELRRRVVWAAFVIDKIHSLYQGRQPSIERRNLYVPIEFHDQFEEVEFWTPVAYHRPSEFEGQDPARGFGETPAGYTGPIYSVSTFAELCRLTVLMERIIQTFYSIDSGARTERAQTEKLIEMRSELAAWRTSLPVHLRIESPTGRNDGGQRSRTCPPNLISLHTLYHALTILLNRPFLPHGHLRSDDAASGRSGWKACVDAASCISSLMNLYRQTVSMKGAPQLISYINFCAAGIHVRVAAQLQQSNSSNGDASSVAASSRSKRYELHALRQCLQDFEENQDPNPGVVKAKTVIRNMAERAGILDLLQDNLGDGALTPTMNQDESPPLIMTSAGADGSNDTLGSAARFGSSITASIPAMTSSGAAVNRPTDTFTPPYEIDFDSILASFDQLEPGPGRDGLFPGTADPATNADILFGFLRDYDAPSALAA